jgi:hypothetical protein
MSTINWKETTPTHWESDDIENGLHGVIDRVQVGSDIAYWGYTAVDGDIPAGPGETSEAYPDLEDAKANVERLLGQEWAEGLSM